MTRNPVRRRKNKHRRKFAVGRLNQETLVDLSAQKNRITRLLEQMVGNEAEKLTRKGIDRALGGDSRCLNINKSLERALIEGTIQYENFSNYRAALDHYSSRIDLTGMVRRILRNRSYKSYGRIPHHLITEIADESLNPALHPATWIRR